MTHAHAAAAVCCTKAPPHDALSQHRQQPKTQIHTRRKNSWMQVQLLVAMYIIWVTPVRVGFGLPAEGAWFWVEGAIDLFFYTDVVLNFFTAYEVRLRAACAVSLCCDALCCDVMRCAVLCHTHARLPPNPHHKRPHPLTTQQQTGLAHRRARHEPQGDRRQLPDRLVRRRLFGDVSRRVYRARRRGAAPG